MFTNAKTTPENRAENVDKRHGGYGNCDHLRVMFGLLKFDLKPLNNKQFKMFTTLKRSEEQNG